MADTGLPHRYPIFHNFDLDKFRINQRHTKLYRCFGTWPFVLLHDQDDSEQISWCEKLYDTEKSFPGVVRKLAETHLISIEMRSLKALKFLRNFLYLAGICCTVGITIVGLLLPEHIYPKFTLPVSFYLPFKEQQSWHAFITTVLAHAKVTIDTASLANYIFGVFFCISIHILGFLDIVKEIVGKMKEMSDEDEMPRKTLQLQTLAVINASSSGA